MKAILFHTFFFLWTGFISALILVLVFLPQSVNFWVANLWADVILRALKFFTGVDMRIEGDLPPPGSLIACQHQSVWETIVFHVLCHRPVFILKKELMAIPFYGLFLRKLRMIPVHRKSFRPTYRQKFFTCVQESLTRRQSVIIFPEGTRNSPHASVRPYHSGIYHLAHHLNQPVIPAALNSGYFWPKRQKIQKSGTIVLRFLPAMKAEGDRKTFMTNLQNAIESHSPAES